MVWPIPFIINVLLLLKKLSFTSFLVYCKIHVSPFLNVTTFESTCLILSHVFFYLTRGCEDDFVEDGAVVAVVVGVLVDGGRLVTVGFTSAGSDLGVTSPDILVSITKQKYCEMHFSASTRKQKYSKMHVSASTRKQKYSEMQMHLNLSLYMTNIYGL